MITDILIFLVPPTVVVVSVTSVSLVASGVEDVNIPALPQSIFV